MVARYELPPGTSLRLTAFSGDVTVIAEDRTDVQAPDETHAERHSGEGKPDDQAPGRRRRRRKHKALRFLRKLAGIPPHRPRPEGPTLEIRASRGGSRDLEVRCPTGADVSAGTISGDVRLIGNFGDASITTTSGDISVDRAEALDARSVSGDLDIAGCRGLCRLHTKSGHIRAGATGPADAHTVSGGVHLLETSGSVTVRTVSGNVELGTDGTDPVSVRTVSGRTSVRVSKERLPDANLRSLSGSIRCDCPQGSDFPLKVTTVSGEIEVEPS